MIIDTSSKLSWLYLLAFMRNIKYGAATKRYSYSQLIQKCDESVLYEWNVVSKTRYVVKDIFDPIYAEYCYCLRLS